MCWPIWRLSLRPQPCSWSGWPARLIAVNRTSVNAPSAASPRALPSTGCASARPYMWVKRWSASAATVTWKSRSCRGLYREAPLYSIWEGSGNVMCLDVLRALTKDPATVEALLAEFQTTAGADQRLDAYIERLGARLATAADNKYAARDLTENLALALQASLMMRHSTPAMAEAFIASRLAGQHGQAFGTLPEGMDVKEILHGVVEPLALGK